MKITHRVKIQALSKLEETKKHDLSDPKHRNATTYFTLRSAILYLKKPL
jgi:hypothetical protein